MRIDHRGRILKAVEQVILELEAMSPPLLERMTLEFAICLLECWPHHRGADRCMEALLEIQARLADLPSTTTWHLTSEESKRLKDLTDDWEGVKGPCPKILLRVREALDPGGLPHPGYIPANLLALEAHDRWGRKDHGPAALLRLEVIARGYQEQSRRAAVEAGPSPFSAEDPHGAAGDLSSPPPRRTRLRRRVRTEAGRQLGFRVPFQLRNWFKKETQHPGRRYGEGTSGALLAQAINMLEVQYEEGKLGPAPEPHSKPRGGRPVKQLNCVVPAASWEKLDSLARSLREIGWTKESLMQRGLDLLWSIRRRRGRRPYDWSLQQHPSGTLPSNEEEVP